MDKIIVITGASSGIGLATAIKFASEGWIVCAGTRNVERDRQRFGNRDRIHWLEMEVTSPQSLRAACLQIEREHGKLDVLFCNAGFGFVRALGQASFEEIQKVFDTNVYGVMHTIREFLHLLKQSNTPHIVVTSSIGGLVGQPMNEIYCASKFAVEGLVESLATYYKPFFNIDVTLLEPGAIATNFFNTVSTYVEQTGGILEDEYKPILETYLSARSKRTNSPQTAESVADVMWDLVNMNKKPVRIRTSEAAETFTNIKTASDPTGTVGVETVRKVQLNIERIEG